MDYYFPKEKKVNKEPSIVTEIKRQRALAYYLMRKDFENNGTNDTEYSPEDSSDISHRYVPTPILSPPKQSTCSSNCTHREAKESEVCLPSHKNMGKKTVSDRKLAPYTLMPSIHDVYRQVCDSATTTSRSKYNPRSSTSEQATYQQQISRNTTNKCSNFLGGELSQPLYRDNDNRCESASAIIPFEQRVHQQINRHSSNKSIYSPGVPTQQLHRYGNENVAYCGVPASTSTLLEQRALQQILNVALNASSSSVEEELSQRLLRTSIARNVPSQELSQQLGRASGNRCLFEYIKDGNKSTYFLEQELPQQLYKAIECTNVPEDKLFASSIEQGMYQNLQSNAANKGPYFLGQEVSQHLRTSCEHRNVYEYKLPAAAVTSLEQLGQLPQEHFTSEKAPALSSTLPRNEPNATNFFDTEACIRYWLMEDDGSNMPFMSPHNHVMKSE